MVMSLVPLRLPVDREDEPRILAVRDLSWPVSIAIPLSPKKKLIVSCVVPQRRCPLCGRGEDA